MTAMYCHPPPPKLIEAIISNAANITFSSNILITKGGLNTKRRESYISGWKNKIGLNPYKQKPLNRFYMKLEFSGISNFNMTPSPIRSSSFMLLFIIFTARGEICNQIETKIKSVTYFLQKEKSMEKR
jgi:hypothetical protein